MSINCTGLLPLRLCVPRSLLQGTQRELSVAVARQQGVRVCLPECTLPHLVLIGLGWERSARLTAGGRTASSFLQAASGNYEAPSSVAGSGEAATPLAQQLSPMRRRGSPLRGKMRGALLPYSWPASIGFFFSLRSTTGSRSVARDRYKFRAPSAWHHSPVLTDAQRVSS
ncbi:hypothetical protein NDU88_001164 [Pleurodeles waltl]|uniref:Uncharacterized protein n=1 Tax=Pleurodeles waltl TaxID=8319 RepID=A0AAV7NI76_PLEWA|nr:hypothetical protein NDU88_001164 [Pleurodeles waltl]